MRCGLQAYFFAISKSFQEHVRCGATVSLHNAHVLDWKEVKLHSLTCDSLIAGARLKATKRLRRPFDEQVVLTI